MIKIIEKHHFGLQNFGIFPGTVLCIKVSFFTAKA